MMPGAAAAAPASGGGGGGFKRRWPCRPTYKHIPSHILTDRGSGGGLEPLVDAREEDAAGDTLDEAGHLLILCVQTCVFVCILFWLFQWLGVARTPPQFPPPPPPPPPPQIIKPIHTQHSPARSGGRSTPPAPWPPAPAGPSRPPRPCGPPRCVDVGLVLRLVGGQVCFVFVLFCAWVWIVVIPSAIGISPPTHPRPSDKGEWGRTAARAGCTIRGRTPLAAGRGRLAGCWCWCWWRWRACFGAGGGVCVKAGQPQ